MEKNRFKFYLNSSIIFVSSALLLALIGTKNHEPALLYGAPPVGYTITMDASNSPTSSEVYDSTSRTVRNTLFNYDSVKASPTNHVEIAPNGYIWNDSTSQITSITSVTANFITAGTFTLVVTYDEHNYFDYELVSGTPVSLPNLPYFVEFWAGSEPVTVESIVINYSCSEHVESLDLYRVYWLDENDNPLEIDIDVTPGTWPSYGGPIPTKEPIEGFVYTFDGWNPYLSEVTGNQTYKAVFSTTEVTFTKINSDTEYMLTGVPDNTLISFVVPETYLGLPVTKINNEVFMGFTSLETIVLPSTLTVIGEGAFVECSSLTSITLPSALTTIGLFAFGGCTSLTSFDVDINNLTFASNDGVLFDVALTTLIAYPQGKATTYTIPDGVTTIGTFAFVGNSALTSITIPSSVTTIESNAFVACTLLNNVVISDTVTSLGTGVFANCESLSSVTLPSRLTTLPASFFYGCINLTTVTLPSGLTTIGLQAFENCSKLSSINLPEGLTTISSYAFRGCTLLTNVTLPSTLLTIGGNAFDNCDSMTSVTIPASVTSIGTYAFSNCNLLTAINVDIANMTYTSNDGVLFDEDLETLILYPSGKTDSTYAIPASVTTINSNAFRNNSHLTSVYIPSTVLTINSYGFYQCVNLAINCQASAKPAGWDVNWNPSNYTVVWSFVI